MNFLDWLQAKDIDAAIEKEGEEKYQRKQDRRHAMAFHLMLLVLALDLCWFRPHVLKQSSTGDIDLFVIIFAFYAWKVLGSNR